jgi:hypothetical protein
LFVFVVKFAFILNSANGSILEINGFSIDKKSDVGNPLL